MRRVYGFTGLVLLAACLTVSCGKIWRIDPPGVLSGSVWKGTNDARGEILYFCYYDSRVISYEPDGSDRIGTQEDGNLELFFTSAADTVKYTGTYTYIRYPAVYVNATKVEMNLVLRNEDTGEVREGSMLHSDTHFYFHFKDESRAYPVAEYTGDMSVIDSLRK